MMSFVLVVLYILRKIKKSKNQRFDNFWRIGLGHFSQLFQRENERKSDEKINLHFHNRLLPVRFHKWVHSIEEEKAILFISYNCICIEYTLLYCRKRVKTDELERWTRT